MSVFVREEREREREIEEVTYVQLFTEKVNLRSSDSLVLSGDILFTVFPKLSFVSSFIPSFPPSLNSDLKLSLTPVQVSQKMNSRRQQECSTVEVNRLSLAFPVLKSDTLPARHAAS